MDQSDTEKLTMQPGEIYRVIVKLSQDVQLATKEVRELTAMLRGDGMNTGLIIEHERIKNKIDYSNSRSLDDRVSELERIVVAAKWLALPLLATAVLEIIRFLGDLLTHEAAIVHP